MTVGGDFIPGNQVLDEPDYPVVFGIRLTPRFNGILLALLGLAGAGYLFVNLVVPKLDENRALEADIVAKEAQLVNQGEAQQQIDAARVKLQDAEKLRADVLALFADEEGLDTLLIDVNERVQSTNARITDIERRATLSKFTLVSSGEPSADGSSADLVTDGSVGVAVNGKLRQQLYDVSMEGTFAQTQSIIRNIERLQPLLVLRNFTSTLAAPATLTLNAQGRPVTTGPVDPRLKTSFQIQALMPAPVASPAPPPAAVDPATGEAVAPAPGSAPGETTAPATAPAVTPAPAQ